MRHFKCSECDNVSITSGDKPTVIKCDCGGYYEVELSKGELIELNPDFADVD